MEELVKYMHSFFFKVIPLKSNILSHYSLPRFYALLQRFNWDVLLLCRYGPLNGLHIFKTSPFDVPFELGENTESHREQDQGNREIMLDAQHIKSHYFSDIQKSSMIIFHSSFSCPVELR